ncbi:chromosome segregation protein SMC [Thalassotalea aquiviva]|uniref:chromosome segregation protein SMC n=1 Tax=Thalassotalea aquiviva TaxID=3242415 RepID=UPI00352A1B25
MRLKQIKLAGFKSFVDLTNVPFPDDMTAIVGPNGCGKSNIIDAVRWVLGESSAKNLRGDNMTDVIFNGATSRKPVGQASVELIFDNSENRLQGSMADRNEISIRRVVNRDAKNTYFLNGSKCRRKDITDIFLGTGLGPRSYAIIEQGMISKLIESKPQELRVFIEEAAGISKYKERRRETENRIKHTRENLLRLADIRQELSIQLEKLHGQSLAANRFKTLKAQERALKAELVAIKWQQLEQKRQSIHHKEQTISLKLEQLNTELTHVELAMAKGQSEQDQQNRELNELNQRKLSLHTDISRLEQKIKHAKQQRTALAQEGQKLGMEIQTLEQHLKREEQRKRQCEQDVLAIEPNIASLQKQKQQAQLQLQQQEQLNAQYQHSWQQLSEQKNQGINALNINESQQKSILASIEQIEQRVMRLHEQQQNSALEKTQTDIAELEQHITCEQQTLATLEQEHTRLCKVSEQSKQSVLMAEEKLKQDNERRLNLDARLSALQATMHEAENWQERQQAFLARHQIETEKDLLSRLQVQTGWEDAVEQVLAHWLYANVVTSWPAQFEPNKGLLLKSSSLSPKEGSLAQKVCNAGPLTVFLNQVLLADNPEQAQSKSLSIKPHQSVICPEGDWYGQHWYQKGGQLAQSGLIKRQQQINQLEQDITAVQAQLKVSLKEQQTAQSDFEQEQKKRQDCEQNIVSAQQSVSALTQQHTLLMQQLAFKQSQQLEWQQELERQQDALKRNQHQLEKYKTQHQDLVAKKQHSEAQLYALETQKQVDDGALKRQQQQYQVLTEQYHQLQLELASAQSALSSLQTSLVREKEQLRKWHDEQETLIFAQQDVELPLLEDEDSLQTLLLQSEELEAKLLSYQGSIAENFDVVQQSTQKMQSLSQQISAHKDQLSALAIEAESYSVRAKTALEQLGEMNEQISEVLTRLPDNAKEAQWQIKLARVAKDISALGAINLAAIDEYDVQKQRQEYLEQQNGDLESALTTLESAISKIDSESRQKFKQTYDQVNADLKTLFPKVFGGGSAYLELTENDMLEAGVTIMARPPGKKNSTIHLLSGGEKALTALSLVFAIFRLNPAPFCMLDEVDAPLDDANVGRFCNLVKEMSQTVQFIYISHNKIAMEMASHLTGVTMFEPGVSRMVAVDIDEAIAMAEAS